MIDGSYIGARERMYGAMTATCAQAGIDTHTGEDRMETRNGNGNGNGSGGGDRARQQQQQHGAGGGGGGNDRSMSSMESSVSRIQRHRHRHRLHHFASSRESIQLPAVESLIRIFHDQQQMRQWMRLARNIHVVVGNEARSHSNNGNATRMVEGKDEMTMEYDNTAHT